MCGILGYFAASGNLGAVQRNGASALTELSHRGPDASQSYQDGPIWLGHRRLAIIDTSNSANQPMTSADGRYVIVFNGEIYNYRDLRQELKTSYAFATDSDTEVLLAAFSSWGDGFLTRLHGMFALAIWDKQQQRLFLARDRLGVKPLYYASHEGAFAFASRPRALGLVLPQQPQQLDWQALRWYLECGYLPAPHSIWQGVHKVEPGTYLSVDARATRITRYWSLNRVATNHSLEKATESELVHQLDQLVERSVAWRMVSSVPVGAFLSGGIDSSLVVATMARLSSRPVQTFTIGFEDPRFDESGIAASIARHLGTEHHFQRLQVEDLLDLLPDFFQNYDEPFFDYSAFPTMAVSRLAAGHLKVVLSGDGGDEGFGGYHYYQMAQWMARLHRLPAAVRLSLSHLAGLLGHRGRLLASALRQPNRISAFAYSRSVIKDHHSLLSHDLRANTRSFADLLIEKSLSHPAGLSGPEEAMRLDIESTLPDDYLQKVDVASMAFSLEAREPLLEHSLLEWSASLPLKWKMRRRQNKYLLRQLAYQKVPKALLARPKMGFGVPLPSWLQGKLRPWAEELLGQTDLMEELGLDCSAVRSLWQKQMSGQAHSHTALWTVLVLIQFARDRAR